MWYLKKCVVLIKNNLAKRNWNESKFCSFCNKEESIQHPFFSCAYARFMWRAIHIVFDIASTMNIEDVFNQWLKQGGKNQIYSY